MLQYIVSTRFNDNTWRENADYRKQNNVMGCCYGAPYEMSPKILLDALVFVVEMNNSLNKIEGIGLVRNKAIVNKGYKIHSERNYNRYVFNGKYRVDREELERINPKITHILDYILFKEKTHLKRGIGFTTIPEKLLNHTKCEKMDLKNEIKIIFMHIFGNSSINPFVKKNHLKNYIIVEEEE